MSSKGHAYMLVQRSQSTRKYSLDVLSLKKVLEYKYEYI